MTQGAEGEVWLGVDEETQSMVALKFIPRGAPAWKLDMARREFSMLAQLGAGHLNIVRALEVVLTTKHLVLVTEYVPGVFRLCLEPLSRLLSSSKTLNSFHRGQRGPRHAISDC